jgi:pilus assembly protein Flp/PilA
MQFVIWRIRSGFQSLILREEGQDLVEYALMIALIAISAVASLHSLSNKIVAVFTSAAGDL